VNPAASYFGPRSTNWPFTSKYGWDTIAHQSMAFEKRSAEFERSRRSVVQFSSIQAKYFEPAKLLVTDRGSNSTLNLCGWFFPTDPRPKPVKAYIEVSEIAQPS